MDAEDEHAANAQAPGDPDLAAISNAMVRIYKHTFGRGPTRARTHYAGGDTLVVTLEDTLTPVERSSVDARPREYQRLEETRLFFQKASRKEFVGRVEEMTGRKGRAFVSGMDTYVDIATEVFYFEPDR